MGRPDSSEGLQLLDVPYAEVADSDTLGLPLEMESLQSLPHVLATSRALVRAVNQEEVDIVGFRVELLHAVHTRLVDLVRGFSRNEDLGGDVDILPVDSRLLDGLSDLSLIVVELRGVDVPVADLQSSLTRPDTDVAWRFVHSESELGDRSVTQQSEGVGDRLGGRCHDGERFLESFGSF